MSREENKFSDADIGEKITKTNSLFRIEAGRRLIDNQQGRIVDKRLGNPEALFHSARESADRPVSHSVKIDGLEHLAHTLARTHSFEGRKVAEKLARRQVVIDTEVLRQIPELTTQFVRLLHHVCAL